jgi:hypothetical protein
VWKLSILVLFLSVVTFGVGVCTCVLKWQVKKPHLYICLATGNLLVSVLIVSLSPGTHLGGRKVVISISTAHPLCREERTRLTEVE